MNAERSPHVELALKAIAEYIKYGRCMDVPPETPPYIADREAAAFVCIKKDGQLRGCIGTLEPCHDTLAEEIIANAISAVSRDPRFLPVEEWELDSIECSVDVLSLPEEVNDIGDLDPKVYGVIVESGQKRGVLLPDLEGVDTVDYQICIARQKAFIGDHEHIKLYRFTVDRYY